jgi:hypothetical protein
MNSALPTAFEIKAITKNNIQEELIKPYGQFPQPSNPKQINLKIPQTNEAVELY